MKKMKMAMKPMAMKKMAMKKSIFGKKVSIFHGVKQKTKGGLTKDALTKNKRGKIVSKKASAAGKKRKNISAWGAAVKKARAALKVEGFCPVGGKAAAGQALYKKTKSFYK